MQTGRPDQTIYTFAADATAPELDLWTRDLAEAKQHAEKHGLMVIANSYEFEDSDIAADYRPEPEEEEEDDTDSDDESAKNSKAKMQFRQEMLHNRAINRQETRMRG